MKAGRQWLSCGAGVLILAGVMTDRALFQVPPSNSYPYQARVRAAEALMPMVIGGWQGRDVEVPTAAQKLLRSNVLISRVYSNASTHEAATFLLVQCGDARDLSGHYPPICYPNAGYTLVGQPSLQACSVDGATVEGTSYQFERVALDDAGGMKVYNFMVLPDGETSPNMSGVDRIARNRALRYFGAAQIQVITELGMSEDERRAAIKVLLDGAAPLIEVIRRGVTK